MLNPLLRLFAGDDQTRRATHGQDQAAVTQRWPLLSRRRRRDQHTAHPPDTQRRTTTTPHHEDLDAIVRRLRAELAEAERLPRPAQTRPVSAAHACAKAEIAADYVRFVDQSLHHGTRIVLRLTGTPAPGHRYAAMMGLLCHRLLAEDIDTSGLAQSLSSQIAGHDHAALHAILLRLRDETAALRSRVQAEAHSHRWSFTASLGLALDPDRQQPWRRSDPHLPVNGIVAPALTMDGRLYCKQWVTTGPPLLPE